MMIKRLVHNCIVWISSINEQFMRTIGPFNSQSLKQLLWWMPEIRWNVVISPSAHDYVLFFLSFWEPLLSFPYLLKFICLGPLTCYHCQCASFPVAVNDFLKKMSCEDVLFSCLKVIFWLNARKVCNIKEKKHLPIGKMVVWKCIVKFEVGPWILVMLRWGPWTLYAHLR